MIFVAKLLYNIDVARRLGTLKTKNLIAHRVKITRSAFADGMKKRIQRSANSDAPFLFTAKSFLDVTDKRLIALTF